MSDESEMFGTTRVCMGKEMLPRSSQRPRVSARSPLRARAFHDIAKHLVLILLLAASSFTPQVHSESAGNRGPSYAQAFGQCEDYIAHYWYGAYGHYGVYGSPTCVDMSEGNFYEIQALDERDGSTMHLGKWHYELANGAPDPGKNGGPPCDCAGDPINLTSGQEFRDDLDGGQGPLAFHRFYSSDPSAAGGQIGTGWRSSFDASVVVKEDSTNGVAVVYRPNGKILTFYKSGNVWVADPDVHETLIGYGSPGTRTGWLFFDSGTRTDELYNAAGQIVSITDAHGLVTNFVYSTSATPQSLAPSAGLLISVIDPHGRLLSFSYTSNSRLGTVTQPDGSKVAYSYDDKSNLSRVTYGDGSFQEYRYNEPGLNDSSQPALTGVFDESGARFATIRYQSQKIGLGWQMLVTSSSLAGNVDVTNVSYAPGSTTVTYPGGAQVVLGTVVSNGTLHTTSLSAPCGRNCGQPNQAATYDANGHVASRKDFDGNVTALTYGANGLLAQTVEARGTDAQRTTDTAWDVSLRLPLIRTVRDSAGKVTSKEGWEYNSAGMETAQCLIDPATAPSYTCSASVVAPAGVRRLVTIWCTAIDTTTCPLIGLLLKTDGPRTDVTDTVSYAYYLTTDESGCATQGGTCHHLGDLKSTTDGNDLATTYVSYDKAGRVTRTQDANGVLTDYTYTHRGWLATKVVRADPSGSASSSDAVTTIAYDPTGTVHSVKDADGVTTTYIYDAAHRLTDITDAQGNRTHYTLDAVGNRTAEQVLTSTGTVVRSLGRRFNTLGQLTALTDGLNRTVFNAGLTDSYDGNGNLVHSQDGLSVQQKQAYDGLNRLVSTVRDYQGSQPATSNAQSVTSYDALDRVTGFSDPDGLNTTYDIDALGNVTGLHSPDTGTTKRGFDIAGNPISSVDATNVTTASTFDATGRLTATTYADTTLNVAYHYDETDAVTGCTGSAGKSRQTRVVEGTGGLVYCYDRRGNVVTKQQTLGSVTTTTRYTWTLADRLASVTTANGTLVTYTRDANGRIATVTATPSGGTSTTVASNVTYQPFGPIASYTLGNGQTVTRTYDANGQLSDIASPAFSLHLARDAMGNVIALSDAPGANTPSETYGYDALYRLTGVSASNGSPIEAYTYNKTGDRLSKTAPGLLTGNYSYKPGTHQLIGAGTTTRQVDARGNTTANVLASGSYGFGYNGRNRLTVVQNGGATVGSYVLNALGQRMQKAAASIVTRFDYDEASRLLSESAVMTTRDYVWLDDLPVGLVDRTGSTATINYVHADGLGSPRAVTNATGVVQWLWPYASNPFGEKAPMSTTSYMLNLRFPGQYFDAESGLNYNVNRDFESASGRYIQSDSIGLDGGIDTYGYVGSMPLSLADYSGLQAQPVPPSVPAPWVPSTGPVPGYGPPANDPIPPGSLGPLCGRLLGVVAGSLWPNTTSGCDQPAPPEDNHCPGNDACEKAKLDARNAYWKLTSKRIPQFQSGGARGRDANHLESIYQLQKALRSAISRVRFHCTNLPPEINEWERVANLSGPGF